MPTPSPWLFSRRADLLLGGPVVASVLLLAIGARTGDLDGDPSLALWVLTIVGVDVAHVASTGWRVYADPEEFRRHPALYLAIPAVAYAVGVVLHTAGPLVFCRVLASLATLHFVRQQSGWVALYRQKGGQRGGHRGRRRRRMGLRMNARPRRERRALLSLAASLPPPARDVGVGAVVVDEVPSRVGNVREETGDEVDGVERHGFVVAVAFPGHVRGSLRARPPPKAGEADGVSQAVACKSLEGAAVVGGNGHRVVHAEAGMVPLIPERLGPRDHTGAKAVLLGGAAGAADAGEAPLEDAAVEVPGDHPVEEAAPEAVAALEEVFAGPLDRLVEGLEQRVQGRLGRPIEVGLPPGRSIDVTRDQGFDLRQLGTLALARTGHLESARRAADAIRKDFPLHTTVQGYGLPTIDAAIRRQSKNAVDAVAALESARKLDLADTAACPRPYYSYLGVGVDAGW